MVLEAEAGTGGLRVVRPSRARTGTSAEEMGCDVAGEMSG